MAGRDVIRRTAIRAFLLTPRDEILLIRCRPPGGGSPFWIAPGGGMEAGETPEATLRRELAEELGLTGFAIGPLVWLRRHTFNRGDKRYCQNERFHVVHGDRFDPVITDAVEAAFLDRFHWWQIADLAGAKERLTPLSLAEIVRRYQTHGAPQEPLEVEVLVD